MTDELSTSSFIVYKKVTKIILKMSRMFRHKTQKDRSMQLRISLNTQNAAVKLKFLY